MRPLVLGLLVAASFIILASPEAAARECHYVVVTSTINGDVVTQLQLVCSGESETETGESETVAFETPVGGAACIGYAAQVGLDPAEFCAGEQPAAEVTPGMVLAALRRIPLPPSELIVQPPNGRTLVNFDTNFYTETEPFDRTIRLLGQRVDLRISPSAFEWHFGDGAAMATASAGSPYPDLEITHSYADKGTVGPAVDTTYSADFRVNGGPWRPVPGTVTIPGVSVALEVVEATPTLVGYH